GGRTIFPLLATIRGSCCVSPARRILSPDGAAPAPSAAIDRAGQPPASPRVALTPGGRRTERTSPGMTDGYRRAAGLGLLFGFAAGLFLVANRRTADADQPRLIHWERVRRTAAGLVRRSREQGPALSATELRWRYADWVRRSEALIADYAGTKLPRPLDAI